jgi:phosphate transport system protein
VADHATNIAEDVIFWVRGADVRHNAAKETLPVPSSLSEAH